MTNISDWSVTPGLNNASPPDGWPEGMARSAVNDTARQMQANIAKWFKDSNGSLAATTADGLAYTLTTNSGYAALADIPMLAFTIADSNNGAMTLNVDGQGAKPVRRDNIGSELLTDDLGDDELVIVAYAAEADEFRLISPQLGSIDTLSRMIFNQTAAPAGWEKETDIAFNDCALRLTTGTAAGGGTTPFTTVLTSRTITLANLPDADLEFDLIANVDLSLKTQNEVPSTGSGLYYRPSNQTGSGAFLSQDAPVEGTINTGGGDTPMDFAVSYQDVIIAIKGNTD